jgi:hypothetical protein
MPTKRTPLTHQRKRTRISPYAIELFRELVEIEEAGLHERWEAEGGQQRRYLDLCVALDQNELNIPVCDFGIMQVAATDERKPGSLGFIAVQFRRQLEEAVRMTKD